MKEIDLSYIAGIIDGEGTITLTKNHKNEFRSPVISVTNTSKEILLFLQEIIGGTIRKQKLYKSYYKESWIWSVKYNKAIILLESIHPYLRHPEKIYRTDLILTEYKQVTKKNGKYTKEQIQRKKNFEDRFFHLSTSQ